LVRSSLILSNWNCQSARA